ncbi:D-alanyl-D-alanine carboxypeptidase [Cytophagaceae bacterium DM2B3-1]|uniref:D-alanyl-D-alanine carboxypeptidase n=1 Tax=Xanthocytophaga flava TaxID=3048013 RepID=A0ABT7CDD5_9BACT|nr:D-alanyl-D-alanine carboxypeptidase [Xanthocytophaga flavus]MDJ1491637.1 D-alanyl-D-alanine carboxypeptidase [Xanthocytophaga flavus]
MKNRISDFLTIYLLVCIIILSAGCRSQQIGRTFRHSDVFSKHFTGFMLYNPEKQKVVYEQNSDKYFTPASNTKLFTFYTSLKILGDSIPGLKYGVSHDSLFFWGTGDPSLLHPDLITLPGRTKQSRVYEFLRSRSEKLFYVTTPVKVTGFGPGWGWDDYNDYYSAERAPLPIYGNIVRLKATSVSAWSAQPAFFKSYFVEKPLLQRLLPPSSYIFQRDPVSNLFTFDPSLFQKEIVHDMPFRYSEQLLTEILSDTLHKAVNLVNRKPVKAGQTLYSVRADSLYKKLMQESDNFIAEQLLLICASQFSDTLSSDSIIAYSTHKLLNDLPDAPVWVDGSGLSRYNLFTPRSIVRLLQKIQATIPQDRLFSILPAGGQSGTIKNFYKGDTPYVFAKTGSLSNVHCLSGYIVTKKRKVLLFSFMHNNYTGSSAPIKEEMEKVLKLARDKY